MQKHLQRVLPPLLSQQLREEGTRGHPGALGQKAGISRSAVLRNKAAPRAEGSARSVLLGRIVESGNHGTALRGRTNRNAKFVAFSKPRLFYKLPVSDMANGLGTGSSLSFSTYKHIVFWAVSSSVK